MEKFERIKPNKETKRKKYLIKAQDGTLDFLIIMGGPNSRKRITERHEI